MFATRGTARYKMVTSGRLTGASRVQADRTRRSPKSRPEPAYSLYSTESENQVATLHKGLDRCAALLTDILQCENQGAVPKQDRAVKEAATKPRPHTPTGKKAIRRSLYKTAPNPRSGQVVRRKSSAKPFATTPQLSPAPPHSGVKLHPPMRRACLLKTPSKPPSAGAPPAGAAQAPAAPDCVPERDQGPVGVSGEGGGVQGRGKIRRVQCLLAELRTLMVGHGDSAQKCLYLLEQTMSSALSSEPSCGTGTTTGTGTAESAEAQLHRQVIVLNQQLQDLEATRRLLNSQVLSLQEQLGVTEKDLSLTQCRLQSREEENIRLRTELESTRGRLSASLQDRVRLEGLVQQKQQEVESLQRIINSLDGCAPAPDWSPCPRGAAKEKITQYLRSLEQGPATQPPGPSLQGPEHDVDSLSGDCSVQSESSLDTRDEAAFRDGLAALDASIASLRKTLKMDLVKL